MVVIYNWNDYGNRRSWRAIRCDLKGFMTTLRFMTERKKDGWMDIHIQGWMGSHCGGKFLVAWSHCVDA